MTVEIGVRLAEHVAETRVVAGDVTSRAAKAGLVDYIASSAMGRNTKEVRKLLAWARAQGETMAGRAPVAWSERFSPSNTALVNGTQAHAIDIDDVHPAVRGHPSSVVLSALFAAADENASGEDFISAYVAGVETMATLGNLLNPEHYNKGWHSTATLGALGAAAAVGRLAGTAPRSIAMAMSLASSQSGGLRLQFGTMAKPLQVGLAARTGVSAAEWVAAGLTSNPDFLDPKLGFAALHGAYLDADSTFETWGRPWAISEPGLWFKRYPFCGAALSGAEATQNVVAHESFHRSAVRRVEVAFPEGADAALVYSSPATGEAGRFSIEYIVACILDGLPLTIETFSQRPVGEPTVRTMALIERLTMDPLDRAGFGSDTRPTSVTIELHSGERNTSIVATPLGSPTRPLNAGQRRQKLLDGLLDDHLVDSVIERVEEIDSGSLTPLYEVFNEVALQMSERT